MARRACAIRSVLARFDAEGDAIVGHLNEAAFDVEFKRFVAGTHHPALIEAGDDGRMVVEHLKASLLARHVDEFGFAFKDCLFGRQDGHVHIIYFINNLKKKQGLRL